jgi:hypothetical protein
MTGIEWSVAVRSVQSFGDEVGVERASRTRDAFA